MKKTKEKCCEQIAKRLVCPRGELLLPSLGTVKKKKKALTVTNKESDLEFPTTVNNQGLVR